MAFSPTVLGPEAMFDEHGPTSCLGGKIDGIERVFDQENPSIALLSQSDLSGFADSMQSWVLGWKGHLRVRAYMAMCLLKREDQILKGSRCLQRETERRKY